MGKDLGVGHNVYRFVEWKECKTGVLGHYWAEGK